MNTSSLFSNPKTSTTTLTTQTHTNSLSHKIVQCWMRQNHSKYQQLLINTKQLQLQLLEQEAINRKILKSFEMKKKQIDDLQAKYNNYCVQVGKKKNYLVSYYKHLNDKLKSQSTSINLFAQLQSLTTTLNNKLQAQKNGFGQSIVKLRSQAYKLQQQLQSIQTKKNNYQDTLIKLRQQKQLLQADKIRRQQQKQKQKLKQKQKYQYLLNQVSKLMVQKQQLEASQNILKKLLNIQEVHKKHWMIIQKSIKSQFQKKSAELHHKETMDMEYKLKVSEIENLVNQRKSEYEDLESEVVTAKKKRDAAQKMLDQNNRRFNDVENQLQNLSPRKEGN